MDLSAKLELSCAFKGIDSSDAVKDYASAKSEKLVRHMDALMRCHWVFEKEKAISRAKLHVVSADFDAQSTAEDDDQNLYAAIDEAILRMDQQIRKYKGRHQQGGNTQRTAKNGPQWDPEN